jgi:hypothetical protein
MFMPSKPTVSGTFTDFFIKWPSLIRITWFGIHQIIDDHEPDFVLYSKTAGVVIFEVKDWALDQIVEADPHTFKVKFGTKVENKTNPYKQAVGYMHNLMDVITKDGRLLSKDPAFKDKPILPITCGVVFTNIHKHEYIETSFHRVISTDKAFFWDDMHPQSKICQDPSGECFSSIFNQMFTPLV